MKEIAEIFQQDFGGVSGKIIVMKKCTETFQI